MECRERGVVTSVLRGDENGVMSETGKEDGNVVVSRWLDTTVSVWDMGNREHVSVILSHEGFKGSVGRDWEIGRRFL